MNEVEAIRKHFRPDRITTLFVGESAPASGKFFYYGNTKLFREMRKALNANEDFLTEFKTEGFYLDDLVLSPVNKLGKKEKKQAHEASVSPLSIRIRDYQPATIVVVGLGIQVFVQKAAELARFNGPIYSVHFPNWPESVKSFHTKMSEIKPTLRGATSIE